MEEENKNVETVEEVVMPVQPKKKKMNPVVKILIILIPVFIIFIIVLFMIFNAITSDTLKCKYETEIGDITYKVNTKEKFRFGKPVWKYTKTTKDYSETDMKDSDIKKEYLNLKRSYKNTCKKSDGCKYSIKLSGKKIKITYKLKFDKKFKDLWAEDNYYGDYAKNFKDKCEDLK